jgi:uncharacterized damage-inducible protein DinB
MEVLTRTLIPASGFSPEIGFYLSAWEKVRAGLRETVCDLSVEELSRRVLPGAHQIGALILHLGESEAGWIHSIIAERELDEREKKFVHWYDTTETDFAEKGYGAQNCIERIDEISRMSRRILLQFGDDDLEKLFGYDRDGRRIEVSLRWILCHLLEHEAHHNGQISMLKRLLRQTNE